MLDTAPAPIAASLTVRAIARVEGLRALRHPMTWIGSIGSLSLMWAWMRDVAPVLQRESIYLAGALLPLAATTLLVARDASVRERDTHELLDSTPSDLTRRTLGIQFGMLSLVGLATALQMVGLIYLYLGDPVGWINWWELLGGPLVVAVGAFTGVALGRKLHTPITAPVLLLVVAFFQMIASPLVTLFDTWPPVLNFDWVALWMPIGFDSPVELFMRPYVEHFLYLVVLVLVLATWAHRPHGWARLVPIGLVVILLAGVAAGAMYIPSEGSGPRIDWEQVASKQHCVPEDGVEYCAFEGFDGWVSRWHRTVTAVGSHIPTQIGWIVQRPPNSHWGEDSDLPTGGIVVTTGMDWDRAGRPPQRRFGLAYAVALESVGLPSRQGVDPRSCTAVGQGRAAVAVWASLAAVPEWISEFEAELDRQPWFIGVPTGPTVIAREDSELGRALIALPPELVGSELKARWEQVLSPSTSAQEVASWFGLTVSTPPNDSNNGESRFSSGPCR